MYNTKIKYIVLVLLSRIWKFLKCYYIAVLLYSMVLQYLCMGVRVWCVFVGSSVCVRDWWWWNEKGTKVYRILRLCSETTGGLIRFVFAKQMVGKIITARRRQRLRHNIFEILRRRQPSILTPTAPEYVAPYLVVRIDKPCTIRPEAGTFRSKILVHVPWGIPLLNRWCKTFY